MPHASFTQWLVGPVAVALLASAPSVSAQVALRGLWMETANYPASSVIRFEKKGQTWFGTYAQVSAPQKDWGFSVGEVVIRGALVGAGFKGEVLLKAKRGTAEVCPGLVTGWRPIEMTFIDNDKMYGAWLQAAVVQDESCKVVREYWQAYGLERLLVR